MNIKTTNAKMLSLAILLAASQTAWAGKLDLEYAQTSPTKALIYGLAFPGGGHFYLAARDPKYRKEGYWFMALGIISGAFFIEELKKGSSTMALSSALLAGGVKIWEFSSSTNGAEAERVKWFKENFKENDAAAVPVTDPKAK
jgi:hypothetical protein